MNPRNAKRWHKVRLSRKQRQYRNGQLRPKRRNRSIKLGPKAKIKKAVRWLRKKLLALMEVRFTGKTGLELKNFLSEILPETEIDLWIMSSPREIVIRRAVNSLIAEYNKKINGEQKRIRIKNRQDQRKKRLQVIITKIKPRRNDYPEPTPWRPDSLMRSGMPEHIVVPPTFAHRLHKAKNSDKNYGRLKLTVLAGCSYHGKGLTGGDQLLDRCLEGGIILKIEVEWKNLGTRRCLFFTLINVSNSQVVETWESPLILRRRDHLPSGLARVIDQALNSYYLNKGKVLLVSPDKPDKISSHYLLPRQKTSLMSLCR